MRILVSAAVGLGLGILLPQNLHADLAVSPSAPSTSTAGALPMPRDAMRIRKVQYINGSIVGVGPWIIDPAANTPHDSNPVYAFDAFDSDTGLPSGVPTSGYIMLWENIPLAHSDMTLAPGFAGAKAQWCDILFYAGNENNPNQNVDFYYTLFTVEDPFDLTCATPTEIYDGIQIQYGPGDGFFFENIDLTFDPTLFLQLPVDGEGAYLIVLTQDEAGLFPADGQPGLWFTGEDMTPPEPRAGTNGGAQGVDGCPTGTPLKLDYPCECKDYATMTFPEGTNPTSAVGFGVDQAAPCPADCDASGTLNIDDFVCFQTLYALGDPAADCDGNSALNIDDFICFQTNFALGC